MNMIVLIHVIRFDDDITWYNHWIPQALQNLIDFDDGTILSGTPVKNAESHW